MPTAGQGGPDGPGDPQPEGSQPLPSHLDPRRGRAARPPLVTPRGHSGSAHAVLPTKPRRRGRRVLAWIAAITSLTLVIGAALGYAALMRYDGQITRIDVFGGLGEDRPEAAPRGAKNILLVGSDSRDGAAPGDPNQGRGKNKVVGQRSDTIILAHLYGNSDKAQLVSFPRDTMVTIPAYTDDTGATVAPHPSKINGAFSEGGAPLLIRTIESLTSLYIDNYMQIDFEGFTSMVDTLGGVEICLSKPAKDDVSGVNLKAGRQVVKGDQALSFVRQRQGLPGGDLDRIANQQKFIGALVRKTLSAGTLLDPFKLNGVLNVATKSVDIDKSLSVNDLRKLAVRFSRFDAGGVIFSTVPTSGSKDVRGLGSVVILDEPKAKTVFQSLARDEAPVTPEEEPPPSPDAPLIAKPSTIQVKVFNGAGVGGLGRKAYDDLEGAGFRIVGAPGNRGGGAAETTIFHGRDGAEAARTLVASIPGSTSQLDASLTRTLDVVVGKNYTGVEPVTVTGTAPPPSPAPTGPVPPPVATAADDPCTR